MGGVLMKLIALCLFLSACSPQQSESEDLPRYSDMGAAADAGKVQP